LEEKRGGDGQPKEKKGETSPKRSVTFSGKKLSRTRREEREEMDICEKKGGRKGRRAVWKKSAVNTFLHRVG